MKKLRPVTVLDEWRQRILQTKPELLTPSKDQRADNPHIADQPLLIERQSTEGVKPRNRAS